MCKASIEYEVSYLAYGPRFLHAGNSRSPLRITLDMFKFLCTIHQVMPSFVDFVLPFGWQEHAQDFQFSGFREEARLSENLQDLALPEFGRSGRDLRLCYNLRSVERSMSNPKLPWSIRQCAIYHAIDLKNGRLFWITVKGNKGINERITELSKRASHSSIRTCREALSASLETHALMCNWSAENWRWYINDLEERFQGLTRPILNLQVEKTRTPPPSISPLRQPPMSPRSGTGPSRVTSWNSVGSPASQSVAFSPAGLSQSASFYSSHQAQLQPPLGFTTTTRGESHQDLLRCDTQQPSIKLRRLLSNLNRQFKQRMRSSMGTWWPEQQNRSATPEVTNDISLGPLSMKLPPPISPPEYPDSSNSAGADSVTFESLQSIEFIEEKSQEVLLILKLNAEVLENLRQHYEVIVNHKDFPQGLKNESESDLRMFNQSILAVEKDISDNIPQFHGSWRQGNVSNILLEYVGGGTLRSFFENNEPPMTKDDLLKFWENLFQIAKPIARIHKLPVADNPNIYKQGYDSQPEY
jgi:hypothetical protein